MTSPRTITLLRDSFPDRPAFETALSRAILHLVAQQAQPETLRLYRPGPVVAFGPQDTADARYPQAVQAARRGGFDSIRRLAGGRAAVFHEGTVAFAWCIPRTTPAHAIHERFQLVADIMASAFRRLGLDARVGEVPGEYCPGEYSVNAQGRRKLMGVGQRITAGAAHVGGVVVALDSRRVRDILIPVYNALDLPWDPETAGAVEDELPGVTWQDVDTAILDEFKSRFRVGEGRLSQEALDLASDLEPEHRP